MSASRWANFSAWRRWTRPLTAVAVPATTAVRATPRISPGMSSSFLCGLERLECLHDVGSGDAGARDDLAPTVASGGDERLRPTVLVDDQCSHGARRHRVRRLLHVVVAQQAGGGPGEVREVTGTRS